MISTGHLLVTLSLIGREAIYLIGLTILFRQWKRAMPHYYTDLPFMFAFMMLIMSIYTPIELLFVAFYPTLSIETLFGQISYLLVYNLVTLVSGMMLVLLLIIWFPKHKSRISGVLIGWIIITEIAIFAAAFINIGIMDIFLMVISLPTYVVFIVTFYFCYYQKRLSNIHSLLIGTGMIITLISQLMYPILSQIGIRLVGVYTDATWPAMLVWLLGYIIMILGFTRPAPYAKPINQLE